MTSFDTGHFSPLYFQQLGNGIATRSPPFVTPYAVIHRSAKARVLYFAAQRRRHQTPIVLVYALIKRSFILDLLPGRSVVERLVRHGFEVFLVDWIPPALQDSGRGFDAYVNGDLADAILAVARRQRVAQVSLLGYCLGALLATLYAALHPHFVKNLITLTAPIATSPEAQPYWANWLNEYAVLQLTGLFGNCPDWLLRNLFANAASTYDLAHNVGLAPESEREVYSTLYGDPFRRWLNSDVPLAGELFRQLTIDIFKKNLLARGRMLVGGGPVELRNITAPLLNVIAESDVIVQPKSSFALLDLVGSSDKANLVFPTGHLGVTISPEAHASLWPNIIKWLANHDN